MKTYDIPAVEIFKVGKWNGHNITESTLDDIVMSFGEIGSKIKPMLKLGHTEQQKLLQADGLPAAGWVTNVRREGGSLVADFSAVPEKIYELINSKAYGRMSVELYNNLMDNEMNKKYSKVLKAVALLGADTPAVTSLNDFINLYIEKNTDYEKIEVYNFETEEAEIMAESTVNFELEIQKLKTESEKTISELKAQVEQYARQIEEKDAQITALNFSMREEKVNAYLDGKLKAGVITPAQVETYKALCLNDSVLKFSDGEKSQFDVIKSMLDNAKPTVDFTASTQEVEIPEPTSAEDEDGSKLAAAAEKYSAEHGVSYKQALIILTNGEDK